VHNIIGDYMKTRIRDMREDRDLSQKDLAEFLKIHQTTYSDYELGKLNIPIEVLIKLSDFYKTNIEYLLNLTDVFEPYERNKQNQNRQDNK